MVRDNSRYRNGNNRLGKDMKMTIQSDRLELEFSFLVVIVYLTFQAIGSGKNVMNSEEGERLALERRLLGSYWRT